MKKRNLLGLLALIPALWLSGCRGSDDDASVRLINASAGYSSLDMYSNDNEVLSSVNFATASGYTSIEEGTITTALTNAGSSTYLLSESRTLSASTSYTIIAYGWEGNLKSVIAAESEAEADDKKTKVSVFNTATDAGSLDVYLTADSDALSASTPVASSVSGGSQSSYTSLTSGTYRLRVTAADDKTDVRLDISGVVLDSKGVDTIILTPTSGGVLVNGIQVVQGGSVTKLLNTKARLRAVAAVANSATVTLSAADTTLISSVPSPTVGAYTLVDAGSTTVAGAVNGTALSSSTLDLTAGSDVTLLVNGEVSVPTVTTITDDNRLPTSSSKLKMRLVNATNGMSSYPLTLTVDYTALASSVAQATASSYSSSLSASTTATLEVTSSLSSTALYSLTDLTLSAQSVYSVFLFGNSTATSGLLRKER